MGNVDWVAVGALFVSAVVGTFGYLRSTPLISASRGVELRQQLEDLRTENAACRAENAKLAARVTYLEGIVETLRSEAHWWQERFRKLETDMDGR